MALRSTSSPPRAVVRMRSSAPMARVPMAFRFSQSKLLFSSASLSSPVRYSHREGLESASTSVVVGRLMVIPPLDLPPHRDNKKKLHLIASRSGLSPPVERRGRRPSQAMAPCSSGLNLLGRLGVLRQKPSRCGSCQVPSCNGPANESRRAAPFGHSSLKNAYRQTYDIHTYPYPYTQYFTCTTCATLSSSS